MWSLWLNPYTRNYIPELSVSGLFFLVMTSYCYFARCLQKDKHSSESLRKVSRLWRTSCPLWKHTVLVATHHTTVCSFILSESLPTLAHLTTKKVSIRHNMSLHRTSYHLMMAANLNPKNLNSSVNESDEYSHQFLRNGCHKHKCYRSFIAKIRI
jgi:hypothetical protein